MEVSNHRLVGAGVTQVDTPNKSGPITPEYLIIHYTAGRSGQSSVNHFLNPAAQASAHLVIGRQGEIWQLVPFNQKAWHAGVSAWSGRSGLNSFSIGIELDNAGKLQKVGDHYQAWFGESYPESEVIEARHKNESSTSFWHAYAAEQINAVLEVGRLLVSAYRLIDVLGHDDIAPGRKVDPGPAFPMASYRASLFGRGDDQSPRYIVSAELLNVRAGPGTEFSILRPPIPRGTPLELIEMGADWAKVHIADGSGQDGWVRNLFIKQVV